MTVDTRSAGRLDLGNGKVLDLPTYSAPSPAVRQGFAVAADGNSLVQVDVGAFSANDKTQITPETAIVLDEATGNEIALDLSYTVNKATSGNDSGLVLNKTDTASPGTSLLIDLQTGGTTQFSLDDAGNIVVTGTVDGRDLAADGTKLDGIESGATADQTDEEIEDIVGAMLTGNAETLITVTYQDADGTIDFIVDNNLANYSNAFSDFATVTGTETLTNKTLTTPTLTSPKINDLSKDNIYTFIPSELAGDRTITLPLLTTNDTFVFEKQAQTLTNKTIGDDLLITGDIRDTADTDLRLQFATSVFGFYDNVAAYVLRVGADGCRLASTGEFSWTSTNPGGTKDLRLHRDAAAQLALRNSTTAQSFAVYGTRTDASNYERVRLFTQAAGANVIGSEAAGTGTVRSLQVQTGGTARTTWDLNGNISHANNLSLTAGDLIFTEKADHSSTPAATFGYLWTKNTTPSSLIFTDDAGTDYTLTGVGSTGAFQADSQTQITPVTSITLDEATGNEIALDLSTTVNKATSGNYTLVYADVTETSAPGTDDKLIDLNVGGSEVFSVDNSGKLVLDAAQTFGTGTGIWLGDGDSGVYENSDDNIYIDVGGSVRFLITTDAINGSSGSSASIHRSAASSTVPTFRPNRGSVSGIGANAAGEISLICSATEISRLNRGESNAFMYLYNDHATGGTNYERLEIKGQTGGNFLIQTAKGGTGGDTDIEIDSKVILDPSGTLGTGTGIAFGDGDTQIFENLDDSIEFRISGDTVCRFLVNLIRAGGTGFGLADQAVSSTQPTFLPRHASSTTGIGANAADEISLICSATEIARVDATHVRLRPGTQLEADLTTEDAAFIDFKATADADATSAISTLTTSGAVSHHIQISLNGVTAWIPCSTTDPT